MKDEDVDKTIFLFGKYRFQRMPFRLINAPATFQRLILDVLAGQEDHNSPYVCEVLIYSESWDEHLTHVRLVQERLRKHGLMAKPL